MTAVLLATAPGEGGGPAAALELGGEAVLARLLAQLAGLGAHDVQVITRPPWADRLAVVAGEGRRIEVSPDAAGDLRAVAALAEGGGDGLVVAHADVVAHGQALAALLDDPRVATGALVGAAPDAAPAGEVAAPAVRTARARVEAAASAFHTVERPDGTFLGVLRVAARDRAALAAAARRAAELTASDPPPGPGGVQARDDVASLLLVALVRAGVDVGAVPAGGYVVARPATGEALAHATARLQALDEDRVRLDVAVKARDSPFTTHLVSPWSKHVARWAARRGLSPDQVTTASLGLGLLAAGAFATGRRAGLVTGAVVLQLAFAADCADGQLARYTRRFSTLGAWLDAVSDRTKEHAVYAGLALGAARRGDPVWGLAGSALALQTTRHLVNFSFAAGRGGGDEAVRHPPLEQRSDATTARPAQGPPRSGPGALAGRALRGWARTDRLRGLGGLKHAAVLPIGERLAVVSVTAALASPRTTFRVLLAWGGAGLAYGIAGRVLRVLLPGARSPAGGDPAALAAFRDDGPLARALAARLGPPARLPGGALALAGAVPVLLAAAATGPRAPRGLAAAGVGWLVLLGGAAGGRAAAPRTDWVAPPAIRAAEYATVLWIAAIAGPGALPGAFALLAAAALRHYDLVYRLQHRGETPPAWVDAVTLGWDGRLLAVLGLLLAGAADEGLPVLAGALGAVVAAESAAGWVRFARERPGEVAARLDEGDEDE